MSQLLDQAKQMHKEALASREKYAGSDIKEGICQGIERIIKLIERNEDKTILKAIELTTGLNNGSKQSLIYLKQAKLG